MTTVNNFDLKGSETSEWRKNFIETQESGIYGGKNVDGEDVLLMVNKGEGMDIRTFQSNGWTRVDDIDEKGFKQGELYDGRWNK